jgi:hypothetical protein
MWYAQLRVWTDHPPVSEVFWLLLSVNSRKPPRRRKTPKASNDAVHLDRTALLAPLTDAEIAAFQKRGSAIG